MPVIYTLTHLTPTAGVISFRGDKLHISERFKQAYEAMYERQAIKKKRNRDQAWRRYIRSNPSEQLIRMAENGVPLFGRMG